MKPLDSLDFDHVSAGAGNFRAHAGKHPREILHFRLARGVFDSRAPARAHRGPHDIFSRANRPSIPPDSRADQFFRMHPDVTMTKLHLAAERAQSPDTY